MCVCVSWGCFPRWKISKNAHSCFLFLRATWDALPRTRGISRKRMPCYTEDGRLNVGDEPVGHPGGRWRRNIRGPCAAGRGHSVWLGAGNSKGGMRPVTPTSVLGQPFKPDETIRESAPAKQWSKLRKEKTGCTGNNIRGFRGRKANGKSESQGAGLGNAGEDESQ